MNSYLFFLRAHFFLTQMVFDVEQLGSFSEITAISDHSQMQANCTIFTQGKGLKHVVNNIEKIFWVALFTGCTRIVIDVIVTVPYSYLKQMRPWKSPHSI